MGFWSVFGWSNQQQNCSNHLQDAANITSGNLTLLIPIQRLSFKERHSSNSLKVVKLELYGQVYRPAIDFPLLKLKEGQMSPPSPCRSLPHISLLLKPVVYSTPMHTQPPLWQTWAKERWGPCPSQLPCPFPAHVMLHFPRLPNLVEPYRSSFNLPTDGQKDSRSLSRLNKGNKIAICQVGLFASFAVCLAYPKQQSLQSTRWSTNL